MNCIHLISESESILHGLDQSSSQQSFSQVPIEPNYNVKEKFHPLTMT